MTVTSWQGIPRGFWTSDDEWTDGVPTASTDAVISAPSGAFVQVTKPGQVAHSLTTAATCGVEIRSGADLTLLGSSNIGSLWLFGSLDIEAGGNVATSLFLFAGRLNVAAGTLHVGTGGTQDLDGTISGAGTIALAGGGTYDLGNITSLTVAEIQVRDAKTTVVLRADESYAGYLLSVSTIDLGGHTLTIASPFANELYLSDVVTGNRGVLDITGNAVLGATALGDSMTLRVEGHVGQSGNLAIGDAPSSSADVSIVAGGDYVILSSGTISGQNLFNIFRNAGLFHTGDGVSALVAARFVNTGTVDANAGVLTFQGADSFGGTLAGTGDIALQGSGVDLMAPGLDVTLTGTLSETSTTLRLESNLTIGCAFTATGGVLDLRGKTLTLGGTADTFNGVSVIGGGALTNGGTLTLVTAVLGAGRCTITNGGSIIQTGNIMLAGDTTSVVTLRNGGSYSIAGDVGVDTAGTASFVNAGLVEKTAGNAVSAIGVPFTTLGTVDVLTGTLEITQGGAVGGRLQGAGTFAFAGGTTLLKGGLKIAVETLALLPGAIVRLAGKQSDAGDLVESGSSTLDLVASTATLSGLAQLFGRIVGDGRLALTGRSDLSGSAIGEGAHIINSGTATLFIDGMVLGDTAGSTASLVNLAGATFDLAGDLGIDSNSAATLTNRGLFEKTNGTNASVITAYLASTGTLSIESGTLQLNGGGSLADKIIGEGQLALLGDYVVTGMLDCAVRVLTVLGSNSLLALEAPMTVSHTLSALGGTTIALGDQTMTLLGLAGVRGRLSGSGGTLINKGETGIGGLTVGGTVTVQNFKSLNCDGALTLGAAANSAATLQNLAGGTISFATSTVSTSGSASFSNAGVISATGPLDVQVPFVNTGVVEGSATGGASLEFDAGGSFGGKFAKAGSSGANPQPVQLVFGGGTCTLQPGIDVTVDAVVLPAGHSVTMLAGGSVSLAAPLSALSGTTIDLAANTLTLTRLANVIGDQVIGTGTLAAAGATLDGLVLASGAHLELQKSGSITGGIVLGNRSAGGTAAVSIDAGAKVSVLNAASITTIGDATLTNAGTLICEAGTSTSAVEASVVNIGTAEVLNGRLNFLGGMSNTGVLLARHGTMFVGGALTGSGNISIDAGGVVAISGAVPLDGQTVALTDRTSLLQLGLPEAFAGQIDAVPDAMIDLQNFALKSWSIDADNLVLEATDGGTATLRFAFLDSTADFDVTQKGVDTLVKVL